MLPGAVAGLASPDTEKSRRASASCFLPDLHRFIFLAVCLTLVTYSAECHYLFLLLSVVWESGCGRKSEVWEAAQRKQN